MNVFVILIVFNVLNQTYAYILLSSCNQHNRDVAEALKNAVYNAACAQASLEPQDGSLIDWFGLVNTLFPEIGKDSTTLAKLQGKCIVSFTLAQHVALPSIPPTPPHPTNHFT